MLDFTVIVPFYRGHKTIVELLRSLPENTAVVVVDDLSPEDPDALLQLIGGYPGITIIRPEVKGYFTGAVNIGIQSCGSDVLILNQDATLFGEDWHQAILKNRDRYGLIGEGIAGIHPAWPKGYIHGTCMYIRRDVINTIGPMNEKDYPLWGSTCEYQVRTCRAGFEALPMRPFPGLKHDRTGRFGSAINDVLSREPEKRGLFIRTPPEISVIVPCFNHGRYLPDLVNSLCGGSTSLGDFPQQTFPSFEIVIVDDASTDNTADFCARVADPWKGVHVKRLSHNVGTAAAINAGVQACHGNFITVLGSDDMREPWALETLYRVAVEKPGFYVYDQILAFADGQRRPDINVRVRKFNPVDLVAKNHVHAGILLPKRAWYEVGGYPESMRDGREDWAMNVNLLANGWCGIFVDAPGYLYRREKQNRTLRNTKHEDWQNFKAKIMQMFPEMYNGSVDLMSCCGGGRKSSRKTNVKNTAGKISVVAGGEGLTILRYVGRSSGKQTFYGPITGAQYSAGLSSPLVPVDNRDLRSPDAKRVGMLDRVENGIPIFRVEPVAKRPEPIAPPPPAEVVETIPVKEPEPAAVEESDWREEIPDPATLSYSAITRLDMSKEQWSVLLESEKAGKNRKTVVQFATQKIESPDL